MSDPDPKYWFRAKRYGWGWGPPVTWQGWTVFIIWMAALVLALRYLIPRTPAAVLSFVVVMSLLLLWICYQKGEPPRWRWGDKDC